VVFDYEWATGQRTANCRLAQTVVVPDRGGLRGAALCNDQRVIDRTPPVPAARR
jgi:hypothetical protein